VNAESAFSQRTTQEETLQQRVAVEELKRVYAQTPATTVAALIATSLVALVLWNVVSHPLLLTWTALHIVINLNNVLIMYRFPVDSFSADQVRRWRTRRVMFSGASGCMWGALFVFLFPHNSPTHQIFIVFVLGGMGIGGIVGSAPLLKAYWAYVLPMAVPLIIQLLLHGGPAALTMALMVGTCTVFLLHSARRVHGYVSDSIRLRFENLDLIENLKLANQQTAVANEALRSDQLGGTITVHNDAGAVFTLTLPAEEKEGNDGASADFSG
jgi:hypothetical protein